MHELLEIAKASGGYLSVPVIALILFVLHRKNIITINKAGGVSPNGTSKLLPNACAIPGCRDTVVITATKVDTLEECYERLEHNQSEMFKELRELPDKIVHRIKAG